MYTPASTASTASTMNEWYANESMGYATQTVWANQSLGSATDCALWQAQAVSYQYHYIFHSGHNFVIHNIQAEETPEEKVARLEAEADRLRKKAAAKVRAEAILLAVLTPEQAAQYAANGWFETEVNDTLYRIRRGRSMNVDKIVAGRATHTYCVHPGEMTPDEDVMLAQLLMLRTDEKSFLSTANVRVL